MRARLDLLRRKSGMKGDHVQDMVAAITGIGRQTVNGYCTGRLPLGSKNGPRIAEALDLSWVALRAELQEADVDADRDQTSLILARLEELAPDDAFLLGVVEALRLQARRLDALETAAGARVRRAGGG